MDIDTVMKSMRDFVECVYMELYPLNSTDGVISVQNVMRIFLLLHWHCYYLFLKITILALQLKIIFCVYRSVRVGDYAAKGWAKDESSFAGARWPDDAAYCMSKLGNTLMARAYQHKFDSTAAERDIVVNAVRSIKVLYMMYEYSNRFLLVLIT